MTRLEFCVQLASWVACHDPGLAVPARQSRPGSAQSSPSSASWPMASRQPARMIGSVSSTERAGSHDDHYSR